jgi:glyoxylase-like metal-dependent hydrolase (beta-lactamase superfamily II)
MKAQGLRVAIFPIVALCAWVAVGAQQSPPRTVNIHTIGQQLPISDPAYEFAGVYFLSNGGANAVGVVTADGIVLVDAKLTGWGPAVLGALHQVTDDRVVKIINSNADEDHVGANGEYGSGVEVLMHQNAARHYSKRSGTATASPAVKAFGDRLSLNVGKVEIQVYHFGAGHTDGDAIVVLPHARIAYVGDLFNEKAVPVIDRAAGGSLLALPQTLEKAIAGLKDVDRILTGHGPAPQGRARTWPTWNDFRDYAEFTKLFADAARTAFKNGRTVDQAVAELRLPDKFKDYRMDGARAAIDAAFAELKSGGAQR